MFAAPMKAAAREKASVKSAAPMKAAAREKASVKFAAPMKAAAKKKVLVSNWTNSPAAPTSSAPSFVRVGSGRVAAQKRVNYAVDESDDDDDSNF